MKSFFKLVRQKREKMLILSLLLTLTVFLQNNGAASFGLKYIVRNEGNTFSPNCIGEGNERYEGISWNVPIGENIPQEDTFYLPSLQNDYNCKFGYNEHCSKIWSMKNWEIDTNSARRFDFISDERWQDFPTYFVSNKSNGLDNRIDVPTTFKLSFSVRANDQIKLSICEGWNLEKYSCYNFNITKNEIILQKHRAMSDNSVDKSRILDSYKARTSIISGDEWKHFQLGIDETGRIFQRDVILNRTVIEIIDKFPLRPAYFIFKSETPSLWKIHQNDFFYTKTVQISRLGPSLKLNTEDLCVNLYVTMCPKCLMTFYIVENGTRTVLDQKLLRKREEWSLIKLSRGHVNSDHIFIQTLLDENAKPDEGFWGIDDVRICNENEVRISSLKNMKNDSEDVFCQIIDKPQLRPIKKIYEQLKEYPIIESNSDAFSINLTWKLENPNAKDIDYFISYQANDLCKDPPFNMKRTKSNGFIVTKSNKVSLIDLVPYTVYNVTIFSLSHSESKTLTLHTKEAPYITLDELPNKIRIQNLIDTRGYIFWETVDCRNIYGHIFYFLKLIEKPTGKILADGLQNLEYFDMYDLKPYTSYILNISTSRSASEDNSKYITSFQFTTKPALASAPRNLEIYSTSSTSISLRYDLPNKNEGEPIEVHMTRCNPLTLKKCKSLQMPVTPCRIFEEKYCIQVNNLIPNQKQFMKISLKNSGSHTFGEEAVIEGFTKEQVPGQPNNITYQLVDCSNSMEYCNLNLSWLHPYEQNGTITSFEIFLNSSNENSKTFQEVYKTNLEYLPKYSYQIKYVPYSKTYNLYIRSVNDNLKSEYTMKTLVHTMDLGDQIDQSPILKEIHEDSVTFELKYDQRLSTTLTILVQDFDENKTIDEKISNQIELFDNLCHEFGDTWISQNVKIEENTKIVTVGKTDSSGKTLKPNTKYCVIFLMENEYQNVTHENVYYDNITTLPEKSNGRNTYLMIIIILLILIAIVGITAWCLMRRRNKSRRRIASRNEDDEHEYETLPFDDTTITNKMYDHLQHK